MGALVESARSMRKVLRLEYPYFWQPLSWRAVLLQVAHSPQASLMQPPVEAHSILVLMRGTGGQWRRAASHSTQQEAMLAHLTECMPGMQIVPHVFDGGWTMGHKELLRLVDSQAADALAILDPLTVSGAGPGGLRNVRGLARGLGARGVPVIGVSWDAADPQQAAAAALLSRATRFLGLSLGSRPESLAYMGAGGDWYGPMPEFAVSESQMGIWGEVHAWSERTFDVYVPEPGRPARDRIVERFMTEASRLSLRVKRGAPGQPFGEYVQALSDARASFVVNAIEPSFFRFRDMASFPGKHHIVGRNAEAILAGALLLSQSCPELDAFGETAHAFSWTEPERAAQNLADALFNPTTAERAAAALRLQFMGRVSTQPVLREALNSFLGP